MEGWDTITQPERGPQSPGGITETQVPHAEADFLWAEVLSKASANRLGGRACRDLTLTVSRVGKALVRTARCLVLEAVLGQTHRTEFVGGPLKTWLREPD